MSDRLKYLICGISAGLVNGFFGGGGGMVLVPLLTRFVGLEPKKSFATCVAIILPISAVSACVYFWRVGIDFALALPYIIGGSVGGFVGGRIFKNISASLLRRVFALLVLYGGVRCLLF